MFLSSIKVNGEFTQPGAPLKAVDEPALQDRYGASKLKAEQVLCAICQKTDMEGLVIRPPLVFGPVVKANFAAMMLCLHHPAVTNQTFLVRDSEDVSTAELLRKMGNALGRPTSLWSVPAKLLKCGACVIDKPGMQQRLSSFLQVNLHRTRQVIGWHPTPELLEQGLRRVAEPLNL